MLGAQESEEVARRSFGGRLSFGGDAQSGDGLHSAHGMLHEMERFLAQGLFGPIGSWPAPHPHAIPYPPPAPQEPPPRAPPAMRVDEV